ncbi:uncharacterized protein FA14DRAFT_50028 [Meira miltonrushii]|uniref:Uncharacterized protein n=1 Tax=Meira miltonrushii TaxID=1280837 RepID=A0A316VEM3_9BASI|nr:uncharacterized protein FA14DRAFT_50028 [Meira miltonrushii]PWN35976.1 hypothetical protein FA14DRAFT_50028 [Meira miltonrushii]
MIYLPFFYTDIHAIRLVCPTLPCLLQSSAFCARSLTLTTLSLHPELFTQWQTVVIKLKSIILYINKMITILYSNDCCCCCCCCECSNALVQMIKVPS